MLKLAALCVTTLAASAFAQCNPGTLVGPNSGGNQGNEGGTVFFDITVNTTITITDINFRAGNTTANPANSVNTGFMEVYMGPSTWSGNQTNPSLWTLVDQTVSGSITHNATAANPGVLSPGVLTNGLTLAPGTYGMALRSQNTIWNHNYSNPGIANPVSTPELTLNSGAAQNGFLGGSTFAPRHWNGEFVYTCGGNPIAIASREPYGIGCYDQRTSYGEIIPNPATSYDLTSYTITHQFNGSSYNVTATAGPSSYVAPSATATPLGLATGTDIASIGGSAFGPLPFPILYPRSGGSVGVADDLEVCTSGFITPVDVGGSGTTAAAPGAQAGDLSPTLPEFFDTGLERWAAHWQTMTAAGGVGIAGDVTVEVDLAGDLVVSWNGVQATGLAATEVNTFQVAFSPNGDVQYRIDTVTMAGGGGWPVVCGFTQGNGALTNEIDVSDITVNPFITDVLDYTSLALDLDAQPKLGTNPNYVVSGYDNGQVGIGILVVSFTQIPGGNDLLFLGMPGCSEYIPLLTSPVLAVFFPAGPTSTVPVINGGIPNNLAFNGLEFYAQAGRLQALCAGGLPCNTLGAIASNGLRLFFGSL